MLRKPLIQCGKQTLAWDSGLGKEWPSATPSRRACLGDTPDRQRGLGSVTAKGTRACQPEAGTQGRLPISAQELGPAPQLCSPGRSRGYFSSFETSSILGSSSLTGFGLERLADFNRW